MDVSNCANTLMYVLTKYNCVAADTCSKVTNLHVRSGLEKEVKKLGRYSYMGFPNSLPQYTSHLGCRWVQYQLQ